jgi:formylglycine-generating enzyme required for sulfatase activity
MVGNVWKWVQDCYHDNYQGAPIAGAAWLTDDCRRRVVRGGSWFGAGAFLRSALRGWVAIGNRNNNVGFRVARTLDTR